MSNHGLEEMRQTLREAAIVGTPGYPLTASQRQELELALDRIPRKAYTWLWDCVGEIDRLTGENEKLREVACRLRGAVWIYLSGIGIQEEKGLIAFRATVKEHLRIADAALGSERIK